jgi:hypothetical protein
MSRKRNKVNCRKFEKDVIALLEKTLPRNTEESLEEHRHECEDCASLAATLEQILLEDIPAGNEALSKRFWPVLHERVREHDARGLAVGKLGFRPLALASCFILAVWTGVHLGNAYVDQTTALPSEEIEEGIVPYIPLLTDVPPDSLAELLIQESLQAESEP